MFLQTPPLVHESGPNNGGVFVVLEFLKIYKNFSKMEGSTMILVVAEKKIIKKCFRSKNLKYNHWAEAYPKGSF